MNDLTGKRFGRLLVLSRSDKKKHGSIYWNCRCDCGNETVVNGANLRYGRSKSCGCGHTDAGKAKAKNISGKHFGKLIAIEPTADRRGSFVVWKCLCTNCNSICYIDIGHLNNGQQSCGKCGYAAELSRERMTKWHTQEEHALVRKFNGMVTRCYNKRDESYPDYGGRGIYIVKEWTDDRAKFVEWGLKTGFRLGLSIDRIDVNGPYAPWNCRFVDNVIQANNKRSNVNISVDQETHTISEWASILNVPHTLLYHLNHVGDNHMDLIEFLEHKIRERRCEVCQQN